MKTKLTREFFRPTATRQSDMGIDIFMSYLFCKMILVTMKRKHQQTLELIFARPPPAGIRWTEIEALFRELGGKISEREGSRVAVVMFAKCAFFTVRTPRQTRIKGAVASIRSWFGLHGVNP